MQKHINEILGIPAVKSYSESFKIKVVKEVENGIISKSGAMKKYNINGHQTIKNWCIKYGKYRHDTMIKKVKNKDITTEKITEKEILELKAQIELLKTNLELAEYKNYALEALVEVANEMYDTDLKKKFGMKL